MFVTIIGVKSISVARVLVTALKAHGFHPMEGSETGLPGMPGIPGVRGTFGIKVPEEEAADCKILAEALVAEMEADTD